MHNEIGSDNNRNLYASVEVKKNTSSGRRFLTHKARLVFISLQQAFDDIPILDYFLSKWYICIKMDMSGYAISQILSQLTMDQRFPASVINTEFFSSYLGL